MILVDDDPSIAKAWEALIAQSEPSGKPILQYFNSPESFRAWFQQQSPQNNNSKIFIVDYDFGNQLKGSDLIRDCLADKEVILVSGREDLEFLNFVSTCQFRYLPKSLLSHVTIS